MDIADIKRELTNDEKVLENAFKLETIYKKHKVKILGIIIISVLYFGTIGIKNIIHISALTKANKALLIVEKNSEDKIALKLLKDNNPSLYNLFIYKQAIKNRDIASIKKLSNNKNKIVSDISRYTLGILDKKPVDSKFYKDMSFIEEAYIAMKKGNTKIAKEKLDLINEGSSLAVISKFLKHSLIKAN